MPGAELQLAAYGKQNLALNGNPQITFFVAVYKRYTHFAIENIQEIPVGNAVFGGKIFVKLGHYGDLISKIYVDIDLPAFNPDNDPSFAVSWVNAIGHAIIKTCSIEIGGVRIDQQYGIWLEIWNELTLPAEKKFGYYDMVGKHDYFNVTTQQGALRLRIPLQFWFCQNIGLSLPSIALQNHEIKLIIVFSEFKDLWVSSTGDLSVVCPRAFRRKQDVEQFFQMRNVFVYVDYIYLDDEERRWFVNTKHRYLIEQIQVNIVSINLTSIHNVIQLDFNHPVKELIWVIRDCIMFQKVPGGGNEWFNFSNIPTYFNIQPKDPMDEAILYFEGQYRFWPARKAKYFREVEPYKRHCNVPDNFIYVYSFSLYPDQYQPSGTCNFSALDNVQLNVKVIEGLSQPEIIIFAPNYNILIIESGMAGLRYQN